MSGERKQIEILEVEEYCFSTTAAKAYAKPGEANELTTHLRELLRLHRFFVINWLLMNGIELPVELCTDQVHAKPGEQQPDRTA